MSDQNHTLESVAARITSHKMNRRSLLAKAGLAGAAAVGAGLVGPTQPAAEAVLSTTYGPKGKRFRVSDADILNFALNLEYLEAEYYLRAATGVGLSSTDTGGVTGNVTGGAMVPFTAGGAIQQYANEIAADEQHHVQFLRAALGKYAVAAPTIDFTTAFTTAATAAGVIEAGQTFDPFASETGFIIGAYVFEDVGVTAYGGAAPYIRNSTYLSAAARILAVEAYHAGSIRTQLFASGTDGITAANKISAARAMLSSAADNSNENDQGIAYAGATPGTVVANIIPTDGNSLTFVRSFASVLNIVYLGGYNATLTGSGGFFPAGLNGRIK